MKLWPLILLFVPIRDDPPKVNPNDPFAELKLTQGYRDAYLRGAREAEQEFSKGVVTLYAFVGLGGNFEPLDKETGLPVQVIANCVIGDASMGRLDGHNETVKVEIQVKGLPANSFKKWEKDLFDLEGYFNRETRTVPPIALKGGGATLKSPDEKFTIRPVKIEPLPGNKVGGLFGLAVGGETLNPQPMAAFLDRDETTMIWGPPGSRFAVFRTRSQENGVATCQYQALDLQRGLSLRWETTPKP